MISLRVRCLSCNTFADKAGTCATCKASDQWEKIAVNNKPGDDIPVYLRHGSGVAFFAYEEAAKAGFPVPEWAKGAVPEAPKVKALLERVADLEAVVAKLTKQ